MKLFRVIFLTITSLVMGASFIWAEGSLAIKLVVVNPSRDEVQTAEVKSYLPKEVKDEDILKKGDLQIAYDAQQGSYYVYGEFNLKPAEVLELEVELRDLWNIADAEIESLRSESAKYAQQLSDSEFADRVMFLCRGVDERLKLIQDGQRSSPSNPEQKISIYRENLRVLSVIKEDLATARTLLAQSKHFSAKAVWSMILVIVVLLGVLGVSFYFVWYRQVKPVPLVEKSFYVPKGRPVGPPEVVRRGPGQEKK